MIPLLDKPAEPPQKNPQPREPEHGETAMAGAGGTESPSEQVGEREQDPATDLIIQGREEGVV